MPSEFLQDRPRCCLCGRKISSLCPQGGECEHPGCTSVICRQCFAVRGRRRCVVHANVAEPVAPTTPEPIGRAFADQARPAATEPEPEAPAIDTEELWDFLRQASAREFSFTARFRKNTESRQALPIHGGQPVTIKDWDTLRHTDDEAGQMRRLLPEPLSADEVRAQCPVNLSVRYTLRKPPLVIEAACCTDLEAVVRHGADAPPIPLGPLLNQLSDLCRDAERNDRTIVSGLFSFTGWEPECIAHVVGGGSQAAFVHPDVSVCLIGPAFEDLHANPTDLRVKLYLPLFRSQTLEEEAAACKQGILDELFARDRAFVHRYASQHGITPEAALLAAQQITQERDDVDLVEVEGAGPALKWRK